MQKLKKVLHLQAQLTGVQASLAVNNDELLVLAGTMRENGLDPMAQPGAAEAQVFRPGFAARPQAPSVAIAPQPPKPPGTEVFKWSEPTE